MIKKIAYSIINIYWRVFRPKTYGVKVSIVHPVDPNKILLVWHSYGNKDLWNIPGGGYNPRKESPHDAVMREVQEELNIKLQSVNKVGQYYTEIQGKRDTVILFTGTLDDSFVIDKNDEIVTLRWVDYQLALEQEDVARIAKTTIRHQFNIV